MRRACFHPDQSRRAKTQKSLSNAASLGRGCVRFSAASCWRRARFSRRSLRRDRKRRKITPARSQRAFVMVRCYRNPLAESNAYPVENRGGQNFGEGQAFIRQSSHRSFHRIGKSVGRKLVFPVFGIQMIFDFADDEFTFTPGSGIGEVIVQWESITDPYPDIPAAHHLPALRESLPRLHRHQEHFLRPAPPQLPKRSLLLAIPLRSLNQPLGGWVNLVSRPPVRRDVLAVRPTGTVPFRQPSPYSLLSSFSLRTSCFWQERTAWKPLLFFSAFSLPTSAWKGLFSGLFSSVSSAFSCLACGAVYH